MLLHELYEEIDSFINGCDRIYLYGAGSYGRFMCEYVIHAGKEMSGYIETCRKKEEINGIHVYSADEMEEILSAKDGVVISLSESNQNELDWNTIRNWKCSVLRLQNWKLYEIHHFGVHFNHWELVRDTEVNEKKYLEDIEKRQENVEIKRKELMALQSVYHFGDWHVTTDNAYGHDVAEQLNTMLRELKHHASIYEVGCGLCNILGDTELSEYRRIGIDRSEEVLQADKDRFGSEIEFRLGSFETIDNETIDALVTVNFMNSIGEDEVKEIYSALFSQNTIEYYVVDEVTGDYLHHHRFKNLLPDSFELESSLGPYSAASGIRYIRFFHNRNARR